MNTIELEVLRREAMEEERREKELLKQKYKQRKTRKIENNSLDPEKQALIQQKQKQEKQEKELLKQKYKQRKNWEREDKNLDLEKQALIQQAQQQEQQEKELLKQKYKQRKHQHQPPQTPTNNSEKLLFLQQALQKEKEEVKKKLEQSIIDTENRDLDDPFINILDAEETENEDIFKVIPEEHLNLDAGTSNHLEETHNDELVYDEEIVHEDDKFNLDNILSGNLTISELEEELEDSEDTIDRSTVLEKYNIQDVQEAEIDHILESFDRSLSDENVEEIEEKLVKNITNTALSHPKIEWVNVLIFLDDEKVGGIIKIFGEYAEGNLLNRIRSDNNEKLEVELIQIALYEVWDVFTTLGVNTDDLEMKIDVEVELDRA